MKRTIYYLLCALAAGPIVAHGAERAPESTAATTVPAPTKDGPVWVVGNDKVSQPSGPVWVVEADKGWRALKRAS
jgi:hypothetical protein